jgi:transposase
MFFPESRLKIWLCAAPCDMRKSFDGLAAEARQRLQENPLSGALFVFVNRRRTQIKVLYFDRSGYCIWSKRLEQGRFHLGRTPTVDSKAPLSWTQLKLLLEGIELASVRQRKRYVLPCAEPPSAVA